MDKLITAQKIAEHLMISRRHFFRKKKEFEGTGFEAPVYGQLIGLPGRRRKILWTTPELIEQWWLQIQNKKALTI